MAKTRCKPTLTAGKRDNLCVDTFLSLSGLLMMRHTSIAVLIAFLVAVIATHSLYVHVDNNPILAFDSMEPNTGLLANEAESVESEERHDSSEDSDEQFHRHSKPEKLVVPCTVESGFEITRKTRRSTLGRSRTRAP